MIEREKQAAYNMVVSWQCRKEDYTRPIKTKYFGKLCIEV